MTRWQLAQKPAFLDDIVKLPAKDVQQIMGKVRLLTQDPAPDGSLKKHLTHIEGKPFRIRSGDYRVLYTYDKQWVTVYKVERRNEGTYKQQSIVPTHDIEGRDEDFDPPDMPASSGTAGLGGQSWQWAGAQQESRPLPEPITVELLQQLEVDQLYHQRLLRVHTQDELLSCPGIDDETLLRLDAYMFETPLQQVMQQPDLVLSDVDDLLRYKEGELLAFLLKLSPEQEKYVHWSLTANGPTLVKGGPGTGKSTVALYRVKSLIEQLHTQAEPPRILFTTYTNALIKSSEQLLEQLLGEQARFVQVQTADKLTYEIMKHCGQAREIIDTHELYNLTRQAIAATKLVGNALQQQAQKQTLERIGLSYLLQEITTIIVARQLGSLEEYQATPRNGRRVRLNNTQRMLIWHIYEHWRELLWDTGKETWQQRRARSETLVERSHLYHQYDAVVIDEAQDLDPSALRTLVKLCKAPNRLFVTADANQSIYGSGFHWSDVHQDLKFQGRTNILRANYRSTREIGEAAQSYLSDGQLDGDRIEYTYINNGPLPDVRYVANSNEEVLLLTSYLKKATVNLRLTMGSCAILCPQKQAARALAEALTKQGLEATYMSGDTLDLKHSGIKILTLSASKGLEFPIVALAGFVSSPYTPSASTSEEQRAEMLAKDRRTVYVAMTRAMRSLLVILPEDTTHPLYQGFDAAYWNSNRKI